MEASVQFTPGLITEDGIVTEPSTEAFLRRYLQTYEDFVARVLTILPPTSQSLTGPVALDAGVRVVSESARCEAMGNGGAVMAYRFNPPPGWQVADGFTPGNDWRPDPSWPAAPDGWEFWVAVPDSPPPPPPPAGPSAPAASSTTASAKMSGMFKSLKSKAQDEDWMGKAKAAATQATATAQQAAGQATAQAKQRDQAALEKTGPLPEGALWRGISHDAGRNSIVTLYPDRIERTKPTSRMSLTGMLAGGPEDVEVIPMKSISSVQARRGAWYHDVTVYASGNTIVFSVDAADAEKLRGLIMERVLGGSSHPTPPAAPAQPAAPSGDALIEQIRKLGELRDAGILTPEEFETKKADLLGRL